ncbi:MAG: ribosomal-processing cysteine protease Prp [Caulobacteraceae bacterium]
MIKVEIYKSHEGNITGYFVEGHAKHEGKYYDVVCSAVSALTQTAALGLNNVLNIGIEFAMWEGCLLCKIPCLSSDIVRDKASAILETMLIGLKKIEEEYADYIEVMEKEEV